MFLPHQAQVAHALSARSPLLMDANPANNQQEKLKLYGPLLAEARRGTAQRPCLAEWARSLHRFRDPEQPRASEGF